MINTRAFRLAAIIAGALIAGGPAQSQNAMLASTPAVQGSPSTGVAQPSNSTARSPLQRMPGSTVRPHAPGKPISIDDLLSGITLADEQKPKIEQVRKDMRTRMDMVIHDKNENIDQKQAMLQGLQHMELRQVYQLLTPEQQNEVRRKVAAQRASEQQPPQRVPQESQPK